ncbi:MAG: cell division protein ZapB [Thermoanaerobaculia bacterium]|nr:cell division protein ZapB [Thermoanaerobaculia bacterium]
MSSSALDTLENSVHKAIAQIQKLERDNERLRDRAEKLEKRLAEIPAEGDDAAWQEEREAVRARVETLVEHLEGVLEE